MHRDHYNEAMYTTERVPTAQELQTKYGDFLTKTETVPRPTDKDPRYQHIRDDQRRRETVTDDQQKWDNAEAYRKQLADWTAENQRQRDAATAAEQTAREDARTAQQTEAHEALMARLKREFLEIPGSLPKHWTDKQAERSLQAYYDRMQGAANDQARAETAARTRQAF